LVHDGRTAFETTGSGELIDVLIAAYGLEVAQGMIAVHAAPEALIVVSGYVSAPSLSRANRSDLTLFVNGRWVQDRNLTYAVVQAYHSMLMVGRYPLCFLRVELPPEDVDVNVHPAKSEVRFRAPDQVFHAVQRAVRAILLEHAPVPGVPFTLTQTTPGETVWPTPDDASRLERLRSLGTTPPSAQLPVQISMPTSILSPRLDQNQPQPPPASLSSPQSPILDPQLPALRVLGQVGITYIVAEGPEGMYLVDQHAAHERVLYEKFMSEREQHSLVIQNLLEPHPVEVPIESAGLLTEHLDMLAGIGLTLEPFGGTTFLLRSLPAVVAREDPQSLVNDVVAEIDAGDTPMEASEEARLILRVCKRAAVKAGQTLTTTEMQQLIRQLEVCVSPRTCPHGRPTMIHLSAERLAREFGRK
jgi:DNA mismatch repair protein MutL